MSLFEAAERFRAIASTDPADHIICYCGETALDAAARVILDAEREPADTSGITSPAESGNVSNVVIPRPQTEN